MRNRKYNRIILILFLILFFITSLNINPPEGLNTTAWRTLIVAFVMAVLWITEIIPLPATALLPLILFPLLNIASIKSAAAPFAHPLIFLFLGGFIIAQAMQKWNLHKRIALNIISVIGTKPNSIIAGFMVASAFLSMWISNTATALMMMPIALSLVQLFKNDKVEIKDRSNFSLVLLLSIAYSCSIGGVGTLIGTPPNALMAAYLQDNHAITIGLVEWMLIGIPFVLISLPIAFVILTKIIFPVELKLNESSKFINNEKEKLGKISSEEKNVAIVFAIVALLWVSRPLLTGFVSNLTDTGIAIAGAVILFFIPSKNSDKRIMNWRDTEKIAWGILILFGGGLSLASGIQNSGLAEWIGKLFSGLNNAPTILIVLLITATIIFLTELTSNLATTAAFLPIAAAIAVQFNVDVLTFVVPAAIAASCAFMLPVATPPNAIIFSSGEISIKQMARAGLILNLVFIVIVVLISMFWGRAVL